MLLTKPLPEVCTLLFEDFAGSNKVQACGPLALGYAATMPSGTVGLRLPQADSRKMSDLMRVEEAVRLRCRMHIHLCGLQHCRFFSSELRAAL